MNKLFIAGIILLRSLMQAQSLQADSLSMKLKYAKDDSTKVLLLISLSDQLRATNFKQCVTYARMGLELSEKIKFKKGLALTLSRLGSYYGKLKKNTEAEAFFIRAEQAAKEDGGYIVLKGLYELYSSYFEEKKDYRNAYKYHVLLSKVQAALNNQQSKESAGLAAENPGRFPGMSGLLLTGTGLQKNDPSQITIPGNNFVVLAISLVVIVTLLFSRRRLIRRDELSRKRLSQQKVHSGSIIEAEERERSRIAYELYEGIGQQLSAAKLNISAVQSGLKTGNAANQLVLQNAVDLIDGSVKEVRVVSQSMIPNALIKSGLVPAVREFISGINSSGALKINLEVIGTLERMQQTKESVLFRVVQEIITNVLRHAGASEIEIQFVRHEKELSILVEDNGSGFDVKSILKNEKSIGLKSIQSRVSFLNGSVYFDSMPTKGTTVTIDIPV